MKRILGWVIISCLLLGGCASGEAAGTDPEIPEAASCISVYTTLKKDLYGPVLQEFQERSGLWVTVQEGNLEQLQAILEQTPGSLDFLLTEQGFAEEADVSDQQIVFAELPVLVYNPRLIRKNPPAGLMDLTDGRWQGKFVLSDPQTEFFSRRVLTILSERSGAEAEIMLQEVFHNLTSLVENSEEAVQDISDGTAAMGIVPESRALDAVERGANLTVVYPAEGLFLLPVVGAIPEGSCRKENAQMLMDFLLEADTQSHLCRYLHMRSAAEAAQDGQLWTADGRQEQKLLEIWIKIREVEP